MNNEKPTDRQTSYPFKDQGPAGSEPKNKMGDWQKSQKQKTEKIEKEKQEKNKEDEESVWKS